MPNKVTLIKYSDLFVTQILEKQLESVWLSCTEIAQKMSYPSFFCSGMWLKSAAISIPTDQILVLVVRSESNIIAVLPLMSKINRLGGKDFYFLGSNFFPDPLGLICDPVHRVESIRLLKEYFRTFSGWDRLILDFILEDEASDWNLKKKYLSIAPFMKLPNSFDVLFSSFNKKKRYNLKSMVRKFETLGGEFVVSKDKATHKNYLYNLFILHKKRSKERAIESSFDGYHIEKFHQQVIKNSSEVIFFGLRINGNLIALLYGFEFNKIFFYYQISHDPNYGELSPGSILLFYVIRECCSKGITEFNFLQGGESYKKLWTNESRTLYRCVLNHKTWRVCIFIIVEKIKQKFKALSSYAKNRVVAYFKRVMLKSCG